MIRSVRGGAPSERPRFLPAWTAGAIMMERDYDLLTPQSS